MFNRIEVKAFGKARFKANYILCVIVGVIFSLLAASGGGRAVSSQGEAVQQGSDTGMYQQMFESVPVGVLFTGGLIGLLIAVLIYIPLRVGCQRFFYVNLFENARLSEVVYAFRSNYSNIIIVMVITAIKIFLWTLLLIIPGIVKSYSYRMVGYILAEDPNISATEAQQRSRAMMYGNKMAAFVYDLSFIGWFILAVVTLGIGGVLWTTPYKCSSDAALYQKLKRMGEPNMF